jgi:redoxin
VVKVALAMPFVLALAAFSPLKAAPQPGEKATVLVFISAECPISNRYAPEIQRLYKAFAPKGVRFWLVYPNPAETPAIIAKHLKEYGYPSIVLRDRANPLLTSAKPTVTPEAVVFDATGKIAYQGRIDDRFVELMRERPAATTHDLERAITAVLEGKPVVPSTTQAVGCFIADMR